MSATAQRGPFEPNFRNIASSTHPALHYHVDGRCQTGPTCCCAVGAIVVSHVDTPGKVNIASTLAGGPSCGGKINVSGPFDVITPNMAVFNEPGTPLQVTARLTDDLKNIVFFNNVHQCTSTGILDDGQVGKHFTTLEERHRQQQMSTFEFNRNQQPQVLIHQPQPVVTLNQVFGQPQHRQQQIFNMPGFGMQGGF